MSGLNAESDGKSSDSLYESYCFINGAMSYKGDSSDPNMVHSSKWWLGHRGDGGFFSNGQLNFSDAEVKRVNTSDAKLYEEENIEKKLIDEYYASFSNNDSSYTLQKQLSSDCKVGQDCSLQEFGCMDFKSLGSDPVELSRKLSSDLDSHWNEDKKIEPWWGTADKIDRGLNVSHHNISKFDLVEKMSSDGDVSRFDKETNISRGNLSSLAHTNTFYTDDNSSQENGASVIKFAVEKQGLAQCLQQEPRGTFSSNSFNPAKVVSPTSGNLSRAQLLEALCHSQTRAREAEKLAQVACNEKDHMINLFFQQASCLFACRQWFHLLQLETICLHLKSNEQVKSLTPPNIWPCNKGNVTGKNHRKAASKRNRGGHKCSVRKFAVAFAVSMSLAGAGFLVGWTIGWFFPAF